MPTKPKREDPQHPPMECPTPTHRGSIVVAYGQKESGGVKRDAHTAAPLVVLTSTTSTSSWW